VMWHAGSAVLAYDAQIAAAGITTVFDSFRVGTDEAELGFRLGERVAALADAVTRAAEAGLLRAEHLTHLRSQVRSGRRRAGRPAVESLGGPEARPRRARSECWQVRRLGAA